VRENLSEKLDIFFSHFFRHFYALFGQTLHNNPVRAGIVEKPEDYLYSSARNYAELESLIEIERISLYSYK
jgi:hypothetical protein